MLSGKTIDKLKLIKKYIDKKIQIQPSGVDLTVKSIYEWQDRGVIDFDNSQRQLPKIKEVKIVNEYFHLPFGSYLLEFNEEFEIPYNISGFVLSRSSLNRSGAFVVGGLIDPGYKGVIALMLNVSSAFGINIKTNARVAQVIFYETDSNDMTNIYDGKYKNKNIKDLHANDLPFGKGNI